MFWRIILSNRLFRLGQDCNLHPFIELNVEVDLDPVHFIIVGSSQYETSVKILILACVT